MENSDKPGSIAPTRRGRARTKRGTYAPELPTERHYAAIRDIAAGVPIRKALPAHGFSAKQAEKGMLTIRNSGPLRMAWQEAIERAKAQPLPPLADRQHYWHQAVAHDLEKGSNRRVPILRVAGQAWQTLAPENQTVVAIQLNGESGRAGQWEQDAVPVEPGTNKD